MYRLAIVTNFPELKSVFLQKITAEPTELILPKSVYDFRLEEKRNSTMFSTMNTAMVITE